MRSQGLPRLVSLCEPGFEEATVVRSSDFTEKQIVILDINGFVHIYIFKYLMTSLLYKQKYQDFILVDL